MFCARCGQQIPDASEVCPLCGQPASLHLPPPEAAAQPPALPVVSSAEAPADQRPIDPKLKGVGGWLLFFCVALTIVTPLAALRDLALDNLVSVDNLLIVAVAVFGIVVGVLTWTQHRGTIPLLRAYFILMAIIAVLGMIGAGVEMQGAEAGPGGALDGTPVFAFFASFRSLVVVLIWGTYFHKSERVRATFGRNLWSKARLSSF